MEPEVHTALRIVERNRDTAKAAWIVGPTVWIEAIRLRLKFEERTGPEEFDVRAGRDRIERRRRDRPRDEFENLPGACLVLRVNARAAERPGIEVHDVHVSVIVFTK